MKNLIKLFAVVIAVIISNSVFAYDFEVDGIYYNKLSDSTVAVTYKDKNYNSYSGDVTIPSSITYDGTTYNVTSIGGYAFYKCTGLTNIAIPNSVTGIGGAAFANCTGLTSVTIPNRVTSINNYVFYECTGLTSIDIPDRVTSIGDSAFYDCTGLTSITIGIRVTSIGSQAFARCKGLTTLNYNARNCGGKGFSDASTGVHYSSEYCWLYGCINLETVNIGESVQVIPDYFIVDLDKVTSITIPKGIYSIGKSAFFDCSGLTTLNYNGESCVGDGFSSDYNWLDHCSNLETVNIGENVKSIPKYFINYLSKVTSITIPNSVTKIPYCAFRGCSGLTSIEIPNSVTDIGWYAFASCRGLTSIEIPNSVTYISSSAFAHCGGLTRVTIGNSVKGIGRHAFTWCRGLTSVTIGSSVTGIGDSAFYLCSNIDSIICYAATPPQLGVDVFDVESDDATVIVPCETMNTYKSDIWWNMFFTNYVEAGCNKEIVTYNIEISICDGDSYDFNGTELAAAGTYTDTIHVNMDKDSVVILTLTVNPTYNETVEKTVITVGDNEDYDETTTQTYQTVNGCDSVVTTIIHYKFVEDTSQAGTTITVNGNTYTTDGNTATITDGSGSGNVVIPATITDDEGNTVTVTSIGGGAFKGNKDITSVTIPATITSIDCEAFADCPNLDTIIMQGSNPPVVCETTFGSTKTKAGITVVVPCGAGDNYKNAPVWKDMNIVEDCGESGIEDVNGNASINIYPNPAKDVITLDIEHLTLNNADAVTIFNSNGQVVYRFNITSQKFNIDVSGLESGVYYIKAGKFTQKLIIE